MKNWKRVLQTASVAGLAAFMLSGCGNGSGNSGSDNSASGLDLYFRIINDDQ